MFNVLPHLHPQLQLKLAEKRWDQLFSGTDIAHRWEYESPFWGLADCYQREELIRDMLKICGAKIQGIEFVDLCVQLSNTAVTAVQALVIVHEFLRSQGGAPWKELELCIRVNSYNYMPFEVVELFGPMREYFKSHEMDEAPDRLYDLCTGEWIDNTTLGFSACCLHSPDLDSLRYILDRMFEEHRTRIYQDLHTVESMNIPGILFDITARRFLIPGEAVARTYTKARVCCTHQDESVYLHYFGLLVLDPHFRLTMEERALLLRVDRDDREAVDGIELYRVQQLDANLVFTAFAGSHKETRPIQVFRGQIWRNAYTQKNTTTPSFCPMDAPCYCCGTQVITVENFDAGHIRANANGGPLTVDNMRPICSSCNKQMSTNHMGAWIITHSYSRSPGFHDPKVIKDFTEEEMCAARASFAREMAHPGNPLDPKAKRH